MATKYLRIAPKSGLSCIDNIAASTQNIRKNWVMHNFKIAIDQYANGDKIEIRLPGAKQITGWSITNATTGAIIPTEAAGTYSKGSGDIAAGYYVRTATIATAVELNVVIYSVIADNAYVNWATLTAT
jgi:hypothetical protein